jgi:Shikimate 5'-dehydrogenase C-terminal domain
MLAGPAGGGKDAVYAGCELEPMEWSAIKAGDLLFSAFQLRFFSPIRFLLPFLFSLVLQFNLLAFGNVCCPGLVVADVIPNPPRTQLIRDAEARGCIVLDGLGMLVNQGAVSIRHWTGIDPETEVMRRKLEKIFGV